MARPTSLQLLRVAVLWFCLLLPPLLCDNLLCFFSPTLESGKTFEPFLTECLPNELCYEAVGHYGNHSTLSARGCTVEKNCSREHSVLLKGTTYTVSYTCCGRSYCNSCPGTAATPLYITVMAVTVAVIVSQAS